MALTQCSDCGTEVSTAAAQCPRCGRPPAKPLAQRDIGCGGGCLIVFVAIVVIGGIINSVESCSRSSNQPASAAAPVKPTPPDPAELTRRLVATPETDFNARATHCDEIARTGAAAAENRPLCARAYLSRARETYKQKDYEAAKAAVQRAETAGADNTEVSKLQRLIEPKLEAQRKRQQAERRKAEQAAGRAARRLFAEKLREQYLDSNMDIKVKVSGSNADRITLTYVLFSDVWSHKFQKGDGLRTMRDLGFRRVELSDGYDWGVYWTFP